MRNLIQLFVFLFFPFLTLGNNLIITNVTFNDQNVDSNFVYIKFDISWENSWRTNTTLPFNWDAVWLFVKYKKASDGNWYHAKLDVGHFSKGSQGSNSTLDIRSDSLGAFYYRSGNGTGTFTSTNVKLRWNYGLAGLSEPLTNAITEYIVFGIEMVYVPLGGFYLGSYGTEYDYFFKFGSNNDPYLILTESAIAVGTETGYLYYFGAYGGGDRGGPIPAAFPKGYNAFYCMKYEISQEQYVYFLNTLTRDQQNTRTGTNLASGVTSVTNRYVMSNNSSIQNRNGIRCDGTIHASNPITFYCDYNGNGVANESDDGQNIACNWLSWADGAAYSDWAALRPMTELEFEKACRGNQTPVPDEYAWGSTAIGGLYAVSNPGSANEISEGGNCNYWDNGNPNNGPLRVGIFATGFSSRSYSGGSYYGIMEMSGNLFERTVTIGNSAGRSFTGINGDGALDATGDANVSNWPGSDAFGTGFRGGSWYRTSSPCRVSDRFEAAITSSNRLNDNGFRCCVRSELP